ncbi:MAG: 50S ribosomal protein L6 [Dehalococcoidia bacterium]|nr:50S ribosomal protein L6 [Dehalococcoidia bacterium]
MSRVGNQPIALPAGVDVQIVGQQVTVKGPRGELKQTFHPEMALSRDNGTVVVSRPSDSSEHKALHGLTRSLINNMVLGTSNGFEKVLDLVGVGYRVAQNGKGITLSVMLSHQVDIDPPDGITLEVEGNNRIHVRGIDKQAVGQLAAEIRKVRPPNVYTGKGIRYSGEIVHLKRGKSARRA